ncbi:hypothetical protein AX15_004610 [Amanita polypyramis BW_CC]|nr:hypothetical protein AX15_004610 [Amanita polypyramis BW_CC]
MAAVWRGWRTTASKAGVHYVIWGTFSRAIYVERNNKLIEMFACDPKIPLKKLALLDCNFWLSASVLVDAFRASGAKELEYDEGVPQWNGGESEQFDELRVSLTRWHKSQVAYDEWWTCGHKIDATDSEAY